MTRIRKPAPDTVQRLFVAATELLEDEVAVAVAGQAPRSNPRRQRQLAKHLARAARRLARIASSIEAVLASAKADQLRRLNKGVD